MAEIAEHFLYDAVREERNEAQAAACTLTELLESWPTDCDLPDQVRDRVRSATIDLDLAVARVLSRVRECAEREGARAR